MLTPDEGHVAAQMARRFVSVYVPTFSGHVVWGGESLSIRTDSGYCAAVEPPMTWSAGGHEGLGEHVPRGISVVAAVAALLASLEPFVEPSQGEVRARSQHLLAPLPAGPDDEWLGFLRTERGWLGVAFINHEARDLFDALVDRHSLMSLPTSDAAALLQTFGLPAMSARAVASTVIGSTIAAVPAEPFITQGRDRISILGGLRVADLGRLVAGPYAAQILAGLGADVLRVRPPGSGRRWGEGVEVDLGTEIGREQCRDLVRHADVVVENSSARAGERLRTVLAPVAPGLWTAIRGFPTTSPNRDWRLFGFFVEAAMGVGAGPRIHASDAVAAPRQPVWDRVVGTLAAATTMTWLGGHLGGVSARTRRSGGRELSLEGIARASFVCRGGARHAL